MSLPEPQITRFRHWLGSARQRSFDTPEALWAWSVEAPDDFLQSAWDYFEIESLGAARFADAQVSFVHQVFRHADAAHGADIPAIMFRNEMLHDAGRTLELSWPELRREVASLAVSLRGMGVQPHDHVAAYLPNAPQTVVAFLACASLGAVWSVCSPDVGAPAALDRFSPSRPKVLIACDGTTYGGRDHDRLPVVHALLAGLPSVEHVVLWPCLDKDAEVDEFARPGRRAYDLRPLLAGNPDFEPVWLPFDHPLWIDHASASGPQVQGHGRVMLASIALHALHHDLGATVETGDRLHWTTSSGDLTWQCQVSALLGGTTLCLYHGYPGGRLDAPDWSRIWQFVGETGVTFFGTDVTILTATVEADLDLLRVADLTALRAIAASDAADPRAPVPMKLPAACSDWLRPQLAGKDGEPVRFIGQTV